MPMRFEVLEDDCSSCGLCQERAPENGEMAAGSGLARVFTQPTDEDEEEACLEAAEFCPLGALCAVAPASSDESPHAALAASGPPS